VIGCVPASAGDFLLLRTALELLLIRKSDLGKSLHREQLSARDLRRGGGSENLRPQPHGYGVAFAFWSIDLHRLRA
jgi:hypothetical protein